MYWEDEMDMGRGRMCEWDAPVRLWPHSRRIFSADIVLIELGKEYRVSLSLIRQKKKKSACLVDRHSWRDAEYSHVAFHQLFGRSH